MPAPLPRDPVFRGHERRSELRQNDSSQLNLLTLPTDGNITDDWQTMRGHDTGPHGLSFWSAMPPSSSHYVWELDDAQQPMRKLAEVRHVTTVQCLRTPLYLVGCRLVASQAL